jgi:hypothetical protein
VKQPLEVLDVVVKSAWYLKSCSCPPSQTTKQWTAVCLVACIGLCAFVCARTLLSAIALAGASSSLHIWVMRAVGPALEEHDLVKALTGAHCVVVVCVCL